MRTHLVLALGTLLLLPAAFTGASPAAGPDASSLRIVETENGLVRDAYGILDAPRGGTPLEMAQAFVQSEGAEWGLPAWETLRLTSIKESLTGTHLRFDQSWAGLPVFGGEVSLHFNQGGTLVTLHSRSIDAVDDVALTVSETTARAVASQVAVGRIVSVAPVIHPEGTTGRHAYQVDFAGVTDVSHWRVFVDRSTSAVLDARDLTLAAEAPAHVWINPIVHADDIHLRDNLAGTEKPVGPLTPLGTHDFTPYYQDATLLDLTEGPDGLTLAGPFVHVADAAARDAFIFPKEDPRFEEVQSYYWIDWSQRNVQALGFDNAANYSVRVETKDPTMMGVINAFYSGGGDGQGEIHFGYHGVNRNHILAGSPSGAGDAAEDAEVIIHEYGHAVLDNQVPNYSNSMLHEGWADFFSGAQLSRVSGGKFDACMSDWFTQYLEGNFNETLPPCLRYMDNDLEATPENLGMEAHEAGQVWSGILWDIREVVGNDAAETLALEAHFYEPRGSDIKQAALALLQADLGLHEAASVGLILDELNERKLVVPASPKFYAEVAVALATSQAAAAAEETEGDDGGTLPAPSGLLLAAVVVVTAALVARRRRVA